VNLPRHPLRINIGFLLSQQIGTNRDIHFEFPELHLHPDIDLRRVTGRLHISRTPQGMLVQAEFLGFSMMECVRCLVEFEQPLHAVFNELYAFSSRSVSESGLILPDDGNIDLAPLVREYMVLEIPIRPLCRLDCRGLCMVCGADLNSESCEHQTGIIYEN
jgi:uncharacterized protein